MLRHHLVSARLAVVGLLATLVVMLAPQQNLQAQTPYAGLYGGASRMEPERLGRPRDGGPIYDFKFGTGYIGGIFAGLDAPFLPFRLELDLGYRSNLGDSVEFTVGPARTSASLGGNLNVLTGMANAYWDFPVPFMLKPYAGLGVGYANVSFDGVRVGGNRIAVDGSDHAAALQVIAGARVPLPSLPIDLGAEYRFLSVGEVAFKTTAGSARYEYQNHGFLLRAAYRF